MGQSPVAPIRESMLHGHDDAFKHILRHLDEEEYERAAASSSSFVEIHAESPYRPYAIYFKLFAKAYRIWQSSYRYTKIRSHFLLAHSLLRKGLETAFNGKMPPEHAKLSGALGNLTGMVCAYTRCENSMITNDPFALEENSQICVDEEDKGLALLEEFQSQDELLQSMADWLRDYFGSNRRLHEGLNACAKVYCTIFRHDGGIEEVFNQFMPVARKRMDELRKESPELSSELNAHILHIDSHFRRVTAKGGDPVTYLRVAGGRLVLSLSAACNSEVARRIIADRQHWDAILAQFAAAGLDAQDFRRGQVSDIFETPLGQGNLDALVFDLADTVAVSFLDGQRYEFEVRFALSAFGVCTIFFMLPIKGEGLTVEEVRALQALICPHSGQVQVNDDPSASAPARVSEFNFTNRVSLAGLVNDLEEVRVFLGRKLLPDAELAGARKAYGALHATVQECVADLLADPREGFHCDRKITVAQVCTLVAELQKIAERVAEPAEPHRLVQQLLRDANRYNYLSELAVEYLHVVETAFRGIAERCGCLPPAPADNGVVDDYASARAWHLSSDTGWHTYLNASSIDEMKMNREVKRRHVTFDTITRHNDALGLVIEQREARASFDDWRFMTLTEVPQDQNLAHIRSHCTDAFFGSEYQAFLYFPDDPQFLVDQYETTVELMIRIDTALKFYNHLTQLLSRRVRLRLAEVDRRTAELAVRNIDKAEVLDEEETLKKDLTAIRSLRSEADELRNLILKAGISRYKDHGDLMTRIVAKMNIEQSVGLLEKQLVTMDQLHEQILENLQDLKDKITEKNEQTRKKLGVLVTSIGSALAAPKVIEAAFKIDSVKRWASGLGWISTESLEGSLVLIVVAAIVLSSVIIGWPRDSGARRRKKR